ncbi:asparagine synthase family protein [Sphingomonas crocodyli]|nr:asparagine synthetase B family protein [Sphingomonas crocodyli]
MSVHPLMNRAWLLTRSDTSWRTTGATIVIGDAFPRACDRSSPCVFDNLWGGYVAVLLPADQGGAIELWRDPSSAVGCYYARSREWTVFASNAGDLARAGVVAVEIDWYGLAAHLTFSQLRTPRTAINGVHELLAGGRLRLGERGVTAQAMIWSPWAYGAPDKMIRDPADASRAVREAILGTVAARLDGKGRSILRLSGGLDSSILAAAMKAAGHDFVCLNYRTRHASGDERHYARKVANHLAVELHEVELDPARVDPFRSSARDIPRPTIFSFSQAHAHHLEETIGLTGASAIVDGGGGDNVFCYLHSAATVADAVRLESPTGWWRAACDMSDLSKASLATIGRATVAKLRHGHLYRWQPTDFWLNQDYVPSSSFQHPWLCTPGTGLPGTLRHIANIIQIQNHLDAGSLVRLPVLSPLLAQPVMETCLRVPSYLWARGGINRRVARDAFANLLPEEIVWRRDKGTPTSIVGGLFETHRDRLRDHLLGGVLASAGFLDRPRLERVFDQNRVAQDITYSLLVRLADAESWACAWLSRSDQPRALA